MIVITGATGTVGRPFIDLLAAEGVGVNAIHHPHAAGRGITCLRQGRGR